MFSGYSIVHPTGGSGLARWQRAPGGATPNAQALSQGTTPQAPPAAGTQDRQVAPAGAPPVRETPGARAARIAGMRAPAAAPPAAPPPQATLRPPPPAAPPPTSLAPPSPPVAAAPAPAAAPPAPALTNGVPSWMFGQADRAAAAGYPTSQSQAQAPAAGNYMPVPAGFVSNGDPVLRAPLNMDGTALSGAQLAALAGTGRPGDPFTGGFSPIGGWNAGNGGRSADEQAAAVAAYKAQYGDPSVTAGQVLSSTSNNPAQVEAARQAYQSWMDSTGRFL